MTFRTAFFDPPNVDLNPNDGQPKGDVVQQIVSRIVLDLKIPSDGPLDA